MKCKHQIQVSIIRIILFIGIHSGICFPVFGQFTVRFDVYDPAQKPEIFLAGSFNDWNAGSPDYKLKDVDQTHKSITIKIKSSGKYVFKFTRGNWNTVESSPAGLNIDDREIEIQGDTTLHLTIAGWSDGNFDLSKSPDSLHTRAHIFGPFAVRFDVYDPAQQPEIFIAGSFNYWNPGNPDYKLRHVDQSHKSIVIKINAAGKYQFKFTRGNWGTVESGPAGFNIKDRDIEIHNDTILHLTIAGWLDGYFDLSKFPDSIRIPAYWNRSFFFQETDLDSSYKYAMEAYQLSKKTNDKKFIAGSLTKLAQ